MEKGKKVPSVFDSLLPQYKVDGFDPNAALTKVVDIDENGQPLESLFMKYLPALEWFLTVYPGGCLNHTFIALTERKATVTASIYRCQSDTRPAATATCTRYFEENENGKYFEQNAVTAAYRKALGYLGFGTPLNAVEVDGIPTESGGNIPERTDAGVVITPVSTNTPEQSPASSEEEKKSDAESNKRTRGQKRSKETLPAAVATPKVASAETLPVKSAEPAEEPVQQMMSEATQMAQNFMSAPETAPATPTAPVATPAAPQGVPKTLDEALEVIVPYGDMVGKTVREAAKERGNAFIRWHCDKAQLRAPNSPFAMATQLYCEFNGC